MSIEARLRMLERSSPTARLRPEGMGFDEYVALMSAAIKASPYSTGLWLNELTRTELLQLREALREFISADDASRSDPTAEDR